MMREEELPLLLMEDRTASGLDRDLLRVPFSHATEIAGGLDLQLSGELPDDWSLGLARYLAGRGISLQNGYARRIEGRVWLAKLEIRTPSPVPLPDFLAVALRHRGARPAVEPPIGDFELGPNPRRRGQLALRVVARDAVGVLAAVLGRVAEVGLVTDEILLVTEGSAATHRLGVRRRDGGAPRADQRRTLCRALDELVRSL